MRLPQYYATAALSLRRQLYAPLALVSRVVFLGLMLFVFSRLWQAVFPPGSSVSARDNVWYLAITEWITLAHPRLHLEIERDVRTGDLTYQLTRPGSYLASKVAEALGELALWLVVMGVAATLFAYLLAGGLPTDPRGLWLALPLGVLAALLATLCNAIIGVSAFWLLDCTPVYWIFQKATFIFGGLMVPLSLYPEWLRSIALVTPFSALLHGPGSMAFGLAPALVLTSSLKLLGWIAVSLVVLPLLFRRGLTALDLHGG